MKNVLRPLFLLCTLSTSLGLVGCGDAETTINEIAPKPDDDKHNHGGGEPDGKAAGRLLIMNNADADTTSNADIYDLHDKDLLASIPLDAQPSAVYATGGYRYAALVHRGADKVEFIDGGLWQEPHGDHFDLFSKTPTLASFSLTGSRPTHFVLHEAQTAVFFDGNSSTGANASVQVVNNSTIEKSTTPAAFNFAVPMHGVAEPRGEHIVASIRRDDALTTSSNFILPDQVAVYHQHDGSYEQEQVFDVTCPDLHGAAQNKDYIIFGCSDGLLLVTDNGDDSYSAQKLNYSKDIAEGLRIGSLWGHEDSGQFIGQASARNSDTIQFFAIDPAEAEMELIDWQPMANAKPLAREFTYAAEQFAILDDQGYLTLIEPHVEGEHTHWDYGTRIDISTADVSAMPEGMTFSMSVAQNAHQAFIADPIEQHVLIIDLELAEISGDIELDYAPAKITWLGISDTHEH